jgi:membrane protein DedA with SNARE-associated domain
MNTHTLMHLLATYGYLAVLLLVAIESTGIPVPGESMLIAASIYAATTHHLSIAVVVVAAALGAMVGDNLGYLAGRHGGTALIRRYGHLVRLDERKLAVGQYLFDTHGGKVVFFGRFVAILRMWAAFLAGMHHMPWKRFMLFNAGGAAGWATLMGVGAYSLGGTMARLGGVMGVTGAVLAALLMVGVSVALKRKERSLQVKVTEHRCRPIAA